MSIINFHTNSDFYNSLYELLKQLEAPTKNAILVGGNVTIGLGFDLNTGGPAVRNAVFSALGLKVNGGNGTPAQIAAEQNYIALLNAAIDARDLATLNDIMAARADDAILDGYADNRIPTFAFTDRDGNGSTDDEIRAAFNEALPYYQGLVSQKLFGNATAWKTYQDAQGVPFATSSEFESLLSLAWNGGAGLIGKRLKADILSGNRVAAWYEITFGSNSNSVGTQTGVHIYGLENRRLQEAAVFGLYGPTGGINGGRKLKGSASHYILNKNYWRRSPIEFTA